MQEIDKKKALRTVATDLLLAQKLLALIADESSCFEISPEASRPVGSTDRGVTGDLQPAAAAPTDTDVEMEDASAPAGDGAVQAPQPIKCSRKYSLCYVRL